MDSVAHLRLSLYRLKANLWLENGRLRYRAPPGVITPRTMDLLRNRNAEIITFLSRSQSLPSIGETISADLPCERTPPGPPSDLQSRTQSGPVPTAGPYWEILRLRKPAELTDFSWSLRERKLELHVACNAAWLFQCADCDTTMTVQDVEAPRCWKHSSARLNILVWANVPRCCCVTHGTREVPAPWLTSDFRLWLNRGGKPNRTLSTRLKQTLQRRSWQLRHAAAVRQIRPLLDTWRSPRIARALIAVRSVPSSVVL